MKTALETAISASASSRPATQATMLTAIVADMVAARHGVVVVSSAGEVPIWRQLLVEAAQAEDLQTRAGSVIAVYPQGTDSAPVCWEVVVGHAPKTPKRRMVVHVEPVVWELRAQALVDGFPAQIGA